jgi:arsenate reductase
MIYIFDILCWGGRYYTALSMKKVYYLKNCTTCKRIIKEAGIDGEFTMQDIKQDMFSANELDQMAKMAGSYEALFSKKARKYREYNLHLEQLEESDYRNYLLEDYTFLKRPTVLVDNKLFVGSQNSTVNELASHMLKLKKQKTN